ncbi:hypothetical protein K3495_g10404 [Podosphaera aphanis]|nr:hypothetical protein K3495_g10404 [Podosphaera aphanis]
MARVQEASLLFGEEASFLDIQAERESLKNLPPHMLLKAYESYRSDLAEVATWHFHAYINRAAYVNSPVHNAQTPARVSPVPEMPTRATTPAPAPPQAVRIQLPNPNAFPPIAKTPAAPAKTLKPTYTNAAQAPITRMSQSSKKAKAASLRPQSSQPQLRSDNGLFARMEEHNKWLTIPTYTALCVI